MNHFKLFEEYVRDERFQRGVGANEKLDAEIKAFERVVHNLESLKCKVTDIKMPGTIKDGTCIVTSDIGSKWLLESIGNFEFDHLKVITHGFRIKYQSYSKSDDTYSLAAGEIGEVFERILKLEKTLMIIEKFLKSINANPQSEWKYRLQRMNRPHNGVTWVHGYLTFLEEEPLDYISGFGIKDNFGYETDDSGQLDTEILVNLSNHRNFQYFKYETNQFFVKLIEQGKDIHVLPQNVLDLLYSISNKPFGEGIEKIAYLMRGAISSKEFGI